MSHFDQVPVVEVHKDNLAELWPSLLLSVKQATFIAMDTELSGLGNRKQLNARDLDDRYHYMCQVARTRSIVSLGLSCFKLLPTSQVPSGDRIDPKSPLSKGTATKLHFQVQTYNIVMLCSDEYVVEPLSLRFLVEHGFDFNKQYACGLPYHRGNDKCTDDSEEPSLRRLFSELLLSKAPVVLHNAVVDLVFLYHSLYASLPTTQQVFLADLAQMFPAGVFDTKYITDFKARIGASYLEFVFRKCQRDNIESEKEGWSHINTSFIDYKETMDDIVYQACGLPNMSSESDLSMDALCMQYANHGWCPEGSDCPKSHNIDLILETQDQATPSKRKKKRRHGDKTSDKNMTAGSTEECLDQDKNMTAGSTEECLDQDKNMTAGSTEECLDQDTGRERTVTMVTADEHSTQDDTNEAPSKEEPSQSQDRFISSAGSHRAGFDAFMTGFIYGFFSARFGKKPETTMHKGGELGMEEYKNKVYLVGKDIPLQIMKSSFSKSSKDHRTKIKKLGIVT